MPDAPRRATALRYGGGADAPEVVERARQLGLNAVAGCSIVAGVPVREDPALVEALSRLEVGQLVPPELYVAVAETLVWAYRLDARAAAARRRPGTEPRRP